MTDNPTKPDRSREGPDLKLTLFEPQPAVGVLAGLMFAIVVLNALFGTVVMNRVMGIAGLAIGAWMLGFRPMSRTNPKLRLIDFGLALLVLAQAWRALGHWSR